MPIDDKQFADWIKNLSAQINSKADKLDIERFVKTVEELSEKLDNKVDKSDLQSLVSAVSELTELVSGKKKPEEGIYFQLYTLKQFAIDELGYGKPSKERISARVKRVEDVIFTLSLIISPVSVWAVIQILDFFFGAVFHPGSVPVLGVPTPKP